MIDTNVHMLLPIFSFILPVSGGGGSLQRESGTSLPATCSQLALPQDTPALAPKPAGLQGCGTASHRALRGIALGYPFCFICFHPFIWTGAYRWITVLCFVFSFSFYDKLFRFYTDVYMICQGFSLIGNEGVSVFPSVTWWSWPLVLSVVVFICCSKAALFFLPHIFIFWWPEVSFLSLWAYVSGQ